jgi:uncharacterized lipoprotein
VKARVAIRKARSLALAPILAASVAACSSWSNGNPCESKEEYQDSQSVAPISVPAGLDHPDPTARLDVPNEPKPAEPLSQSAGCLELPPNYFDKPVKGSAD